MPIDPLRRGDFRRKCVHAKGDLRVIAKTPLRPIRLMAYVGTAGGVVSLLRRTLLLMTGKREKTSRCCHDTDGPTDHSERTRDPDEDVKIPTVKVLERFGGADMLPLRVVAETDPDPSQHYAIREWVAEAIAAIQKRAQAPNFETD